MPEFDRFEYAANLRHASRHRAQLSPLWPPTSAHTLYALNLAGAASALPAGLVSELVTLSELIETEWRRCKASAPPNRTSFFDPRPVAETMRRVALKLPNMVDRDALLLRADALERGYDDDQLAALAELGEEVALVVGLIATWFGKQTGGLPTAFGCVRDASAQAIVHQTSELFPDVGPYLRGIVANLTITAPPAFLAANVFFMAGEGNRHPKHIAYFLPEDEGVKKSPFKKTYYFVNTHRALLEQISLPLARQFLAAPLCPDLDTLARVQTLGVNGHELGHFVLHHETAYSALNRADRWASVVLQETSADVFGTLIAAEVWAPSMGLTAEDVVKYYLAECLRYVDRGLGYFPDSDGMYLQLTYLARVGALTIAGDHTPQLIGNPQAVLAGLRSLARILGDSLLVNNVHRCLVLHQKFGPGSLSPVSKITSIMSVGTQKSIEYIQEFVNATEKSASAA